MTVVEIMQIMQIMRHLELPEKTERNESETKPTKATPAKTGAQRQNRRCWPASPGRAIRSPIARNSERARCSSVRNGDDSGAVALDHHLAGRFGRGRDRRPMAAVTGWPDRGYLSFFARTENIYHAYSVCQGVVSADGTGRDVCGPSTRQL